MDTIQITTGGLSSGMLILRLVVGLVMAAHGAQKLLRRAPVRAPAA